jgi:HTH-type transcriptional regulator, transcriptional repressor of NAD biosynthesis genes
MVSPGNADNYSRAPHYDREIEHRSLDDICRGWRHRQLRLVTAPIHRRLSPLHRFGRACAQRHRPVPAHATQSRNLAILAHGQHSICRGIRVSGVVAHGGSLYGLLGKRLVRLVVLAQGAQSSDPCAIPVNETEGLKRYRLGLVVGKFAPLHLGHQWLIDEAARHCNRVLIVSYSKPEFDHCDVPARRRWLAVCCEAHESYVIDDAWLKQTCEDLGTAAEIIPRNDASDEVQQHFLGWLLREVLRKTPDAIFCSEEYGPACAATLTSMLKSEVHAVIVDPTRHHVPISSTQIRRDPHIHRHWMTPRVAAAFVHRIALLGGESTGKTTLAATLAEHCGTTWVPEYGRELWEAQCGVLSDQDLLKIAREQIRREEDCLRLAQRYLFCDTSPLTTLGYSHWMFGKVHPELSLLARRQYDAVVICSSDFPFVQDGTRRDETFRQRQQRWYQEQAAVMDCPILEVTGCVPERVTQVVEWLSSLDLR